MKPPTVRIVTDPDEYPKGEWYSRPHYVAAAIFENGMDGPDGIYADADSDRWYVHDEMSWETSQGSEGSFEANLIAADAAYRKAIQDRTNTTEVKKP